MDGGQPHTHPELVLREPVVVTGPPRRRRALRIPRIPAAVLRWTRPAVSLALLALIASQIDLSEFLALVFGGSLPGMALAFLVGLTLVWMAAYRWYFLVGPVLGVRFSTFLNLIFVSTFVGLFLPGTLGAEAVRILGLARRQASLAVAGASIVVDRLLSLFSQFALALALLAFAPAGLPAELSLWAAIGMVALVAAAAAVMSRRCRALARLVLSLGVLQRLAPMADGVFDALDAYRDVPRMLIALVLALVFQVQRAAFLWTCAYALGIDIGLSHLLIAIPVVSVIEMIPLTLAGLGTREAAFVLVLQNFGLAPAEAVAISLLAFFLGVVLASLPGAVIFARSGLGHRTVGSGAGPIG
jgi:glycosyltransferase 2 family protein